jgi:hypothetical protein
MGDQEFRGRLTRLLTGRSAFLVIFTLVVAFGTMTVHAQESNVGLLRIATFQSPRQIAPSSLFSVILDVEYAIHGPENAIIRAAIYHGVPVANQTSPLWQSGSETVIGGGDKIWNVSLTAPANEGVMQLTAFVYYLDGAVWRYYNDSLQGPGYEQLSVKVARTATLEVDLGDEGLHVTIANTTQQTSTAGSSEITLPVGKAYSISVPQEVQLQNSTRLIFNGWSDGLNQTDRIILLDGDIQLAGSYRHQYLLQVTSTVPTYSYSRWYDAGSNVTIEVENSFPYSYPLNLLGVKYTFQGWTGDVKSQSSRVNVTLNSPKSVNANFSVDYSPLALPSILLVGIIGAVVLAVLHRKRATVELSVEAEAEPVSPQTKEEAQPVSLWCNSCGKPVEKEWKHCIHCGADLPGLRSVDQ